MFPAKSIFLRQPTSMPDSHVNLIKTNQRFQRHLLTGSPLESHYFKAGRMDREYVSSTWTQTFLKRHPVWKNGKPESVKNSHGFEISPERSTKALHFRWRLNWSTCIIVINWGSPWLNEPPPFIDEAKEEAFQVFGFVARKRVSH